jgi:hypothetical protein
MYAEYLQEATVVYGTSQQVHKSKKAEIADCEGSSNLNLTWTRKARIIRHNCGPKWAQNAWLGRYYELEMPGFNDLLRFLRFNDVTHCDLEMP